jgi:RNase P subunit RPR2
VKHIYCDSCSTSLVGRHDHRFGVVFEGGRMVTVTLCLSCYDEITDTIGRFLFNALHGEHVL